MLVGFYFPDTYDRHSRIDFMVSEGRIYHLGQKKEVAEWARNEIATHLKAAVKRFKEGREGMPLIIRKIDGDNWRGEQRKGRNK